MSPETLTNLRDVAMLVGAGMGSAVAAWVLRGKKADRDPSAPVIYHGPPDFQPRKITRKEWHDNVDQIQNLLWWKETHKREFGALDTDVRKLMLDFETHVGAVSQITSSLTSMRTRLEDYIGHQESMDERADEDRIEMKQSIKDLTTAVHAIAVNVARGKA